MTDGRDFYKILQVDPEADADIIQTVYRRLAQKFHPDRNGGSSAAASRMIELNRAWEVLRDPARREAYDRERLARGDAATPDRRPGTAGADPRAAGSPPGRPPAGPAPGAGSGGPAGSARPAAGSSGPRATGWRATRAAGAGATAGGGTREGASASRDWSSGRSSYGGGYDQTMRAPDGPGAAGPPPGKPEGSVITFGRYAGWSLGEIGRVDLEFLEWLERSPVGRQYREELDGILRRAGRRRAPGEDGDRRGLYRR